MILTFFLVLTLILIIIYLHGKFNENYWKKRGVVFHKENKVGGLFWKYVTKNKPVFELFNDIYTDQRYVKEPAVGFGSLFTPVLYVKDLVNVNYILQTDFNSFNHRGLAFTDDDQLSQNLLFLQGPKWKLVRKGFTPLFTTAKLKNMYYIMDKSAKDFAEYLKNKPKTELKDDGFNICNSYNCAALAAAVFGIEGSSTFDSPFIPLVRAAIEPTLWFNFKFAISAWSSKIFKAFGLSLFSVHSEWFIKAIKKVIRQREKDTEKKYDFGEMCVNLQKTGIMKDHETGYELEPTDELLAAQAFFFFIAGVEASSTAMFTTFMELGRNPEMMKRIHDEIDEAFEKNNNQLPYDAIMNMQFLDLVLHESMRMYPPAGFLMRECVKDTVLPVGNIKVDKGTKIFTPIYEMHHDNQYYENPEVFDPERFVRQDKAKEVPWMPFGKGARYCIGKRFALIQMKTGIVHALRHFTVRTTVGNDGIKFMKVPLQVRLKNVDFEFIPRDNINISVQ